MRACSGGRPEPTPRCSRVGPIYKISMPLGDRLIVSGADLVSNLVDDSRFDKQVVGWAVQPQASGGRERGLFRSGIAVDRYFVILPGGPRGFSVASRVAVITWTAESGYATEVM